MEAQVAEAEEPRRANLLDRLRQRDQEPEPAAAEKIEDERPNLLGFLRRDRQEEAAKEPAPAAADEGEAVEVEPIAEVSEAPMETAQN